MRLPSTGPTCYRFSQIRCTFKTRNLWFGWKEILETYHVFLLQRRGLYPPPAGESDIIGLEVAGTVDGLGQGLKGNWKPDDRVMALLAGGGYAEYVSVPEELLMPAPDNLTFCQAAAIPEAWLTAFQLLVFIGTPIMTVICLDNTG